MKSNLKFTVSQFQIFDDEMGKYAAQLGIKYIQMNTPALGDPSAGVWTFDMLKDLKDKIESYGLEFLMIENVPLNFYDKVILGLPGREEQLENYCSIIKNMGKLNIKILGHHFSPTFVWRSKMDAPGTGGSKAAEFKASEFTNNDALYEIMKRKRHLLDYNVFEIADGLTAEQLFENYKYFMDYVLPVAEENNVKLALHPDDPPLRNFGNFQRMIATEDDHKRLANRFPSDYWGANLCLGCCSEMGGGASVHNLIDLYAKQNKLFGIHFRDVKGVMPEFTECFLGEGNYNPAKVMKHLIEVGFDGPLMEDHVNAMDYDSQYGHRARAHEIGYMKGLVNAVETFF